jgi:hypothetical protein
MALEVGADLIVVEQCVVYVKKKYRLCVGHKKFTG